MNILRIIPVSYGSGKPVNSTGTERTGKVLAFHNPDENPPHIEFAQKLFRSFPLSTTAGN